MDEVLPAPEAGGVGDDDIRRELLATSFLVGKRLILRMTGLQLVGSLLVFGYLERLYPSAQVFDTPWLTDYILLGILEVVAAPVLWLWVGWAFRRRVQWAREGRAPTETERDQLLLEPFAMAIRPFLFWVLATILVSVVMAVRGHYVRDPIIDSAQILLLGGGATCALSYLVIEQTYRPLFRWALANGAPHRPSSLGIRPRLLLAWAASSGLPLLGLTLTPLRDAGTSLISISFLGGVGLLTGFFAVTVAANSIAQPLDELRDALGRVADGDLHGAVEVDDGGEIGQVQAGFNRMVSGLREREELHDLFSRHVGQEVAAQAIERGTDLGGEQRRASAIFVDLIGSTAMAEVLPPGEVVALLNSFFGAVVETVTAEGGWVNKFEGDGALCVFGVPGFQPDHEQRALRAARLLQRRLAELRSEHPGLDAGIGVSSGVVVAGNVGSEERFEYTVIGRAVNEAARLTDLAKQRPGRLIASASTVRAGGEERAYWVDRGRVGLRGQQAPTVVFELASSSPLLPYQAGPDRGH